MYLFAHVSAHFLWEFTGWTDSRELRGGYKTPWNNALLSMSVSSFPVSQETGNETLSKHLVLFLVLHSYHHLWYKCIVVPQMMIAVVEDKNLLSSNYCNIHQSFWYTCIYTINSLWRACSLMFTHSVILGILSWNGTGTREAAYRSKCTRIEELENAEQQDNIKAFLPAARLGVPNHSVKTN